MLKVIGKKAISTTILTMLALSTSAFAKEELKNFDGCYDVVHGNYTISKAIFSIEGMDSPREIGRYKIVMKKQNSRSKKRYANRHVISGPLLGHPFAQVDGGFITRHIMGTFNRIGTVTSNNGVFTILEASCPDASGFPQFAKATETMFFDTAIGTGAFKNIQSGYIEWEGVVNGCDDPSNRVGDFKVSHGQLCFAE